jgi:hypothetical protein
MSSMKAEIVVRRSGFTLLAVLLLVALDQPSALAAQGSPSWLAGAGLFRVVVFGSLIGLALALLALLSIWFLEWRKGQVW